MLVCFKPLNIFSKPINQGCVSQCKHWLIPSLYFLGVDWLNIGIEDLCISTEGMVVNVVEIGDCIIKKIIDGLRIVWVCLQCLDFTFVTRWQLDEFLLDKFFYDRFSSFKEYRFGLRRRGLFVAGFCRLHNIMKFGNFKQGCTNNIVLVFLVIYVDEVCLFIDIEMLVSIRDKIK